MKNLKLRLFKVQVCLIFLFVLGGNGNAQIKEQIDRPLQLMVSCIDNSYNLRIQVVIVYVDGSEEQILIEKHQKELKSDWIKPIEKEVSEIHFKGSIKTDNIWEIEKTVLQYTLVPSSSFNTFKITLGGTYNRPYIGKEFLKLIKA